MTIRSASLSIAVLLLLGCSSSLDSEEGAGASPSNGPTGSGVGDQGEDGTGTEDLLGTNSGDAEGAPGPASGGAGTDSGPDATGGNGSGGAPMDASGGSSSGGANAATGGTDPGAAEFYWEDLFESRDYQQNYDMGHGENFQHLMSGGHDGGPCVEITVHEGSHYGGSMRFMYEDHWDFEPEAVYAEYYVRYDQSMNTYGGKAPGFSGTYDEAGWGNSPGYGMAGWSSRGTINCDNQNYVTNRYYVYHTYTNYDAPDCPGSTDYRNCNPFPYTLEEESNMTNRSDKTWGSGLHWDSGGDMQFNQWYHVRQYVQMNEVGQNNGILRAWVNDALVFEQTNINFRRKPDLKVYAYWFNYYNGGSDEARATGTLRIDDFKTYVMP